MPSILEKLRGGDLRSIGKSNAVVREVIRHPQYMQGLVTGLSDQDPIIRMRSADVLEKISRKHPHLCQIYKKGLLQHLTSASQNEIRWHLAQMAPRLSWVPTEKKRVMAILRKWLAPTEKSQIVRVSALQALFEFGVRRSVLSKALRDESPALRARAKRLLSTYAQG
ncbi:MAG: hypothetical protein HY537_17535 [Deltaproteobacteria bacterium]|nr:hypothetical protein [Deltaproteobacteria bacterium]